MVFVLLNGTEDTADATLYLTDTVSDRGAKYSDHSSTSTTIESNSIPESAINFIPDSIINQLLLELRSIHEGYKTDEVYDDVRVEK